MQLTHRQQSILEKYIKDNVDHLDDVSVVKDLIASTTEMMVINQLETTEQSLNDVLADLDIIQIRNKVVGDKMIQIQGDLKIKPMSKEALKALEKKEKFKPEISLWRYVWASLVMIPWWIVGSLFVFGAITIATTGMAMFFLPVYGAFAFAIYDLGAAFALFFFFIGAAPIVMFLCYWIFALLWEVIKIWIDLSARVYNPESTIPLVLERINFIKAGKKANKRVFMVFVITFGLIFAGGIGGTFGPTNGVMGAAVRNRYVHTQELSFHVVEAAQEAAGSGETVNPGDVKTIIFQNIWAHKNTSSDDLITGFDAEDAKDNDLLRINFRYNTKKATEKIKINFEYHANDAGGTGPNGVLIVNFAYANIEPMMNVKGYGWGIEVANALAGTNISTYIIYK